MERPDIRHWEQPVLRWDKERSHHSVRVSEDGFEARVDQSQVEYFSSAIADKPFKPGKRYFFEIVVKPQAGLNLSLQVKVGITTEACMDVSYGFSDKQMGWAYYLYEHGYRRHNSHTMDSGSDYGEGYKVNETLGVYIDLLEGYLSFSVEGKYYGACYTFPELVIDQPVYAAVAMNNTDHFCEFKRKTPYVWECRAPALFVKRYAKGPCILKMCKPGLFREIFSFL